MLVILKGFPLKIYFDINALSNVLQKNTLTFDIHLFRRPIQNMFQTLNLHFINLIKSEIATFCLIKWVSYRVRVPIFFSHQATKISFKSNFII
jgi:hypothetical protein